MRGPQRSSAMNSVREARLKLDFKDDPFTRVMLEPPRETRYKGRTLFVFRWRPSQGTGPGCGRLKSDRNGLGHACVGDFGRLTTRFREYLAKHQSGPLISHTTEQMSELLKRVNPRLSAHSLKRGALHYLLEQGTDLDIIVEMARHASERRLPRTTRLYLPAIPLALALNTQQATRTL